MEDKIIDILKKKNLELKSELEQIKQYSESEQSKHVKEIINDLACVKVDWGILLNELQEQREKYSEMIQDLYSAKESFINLYEI